VITPPEIAAAGQLACLLEVSAPKPGNVSPDRHFHDTRYEDFLASAVAIGPALAEANTTSLGRTIRRAVEDTLRWTRSNTNLGIVLLLAPLARAALQPQGTLRDRLGRVLAETTVDDAVEVYAAIRQARPGGLGHSAAEDVADRPTVTLQEAMALAAERDSIAGEYVTSFARTFETGVPALLGARREGLTWTDASVETYLALLESGTDTHIARRQRGSPGELERCAPREEPAHRLGATPWPSWIVSCATRVTAGIREPPRISHVPRFLSLY
jgi:triphosphoribosyl-dephospho-CoA synthase